MKNQKKVIRVIALVLAGLMIIGAATIVVSLLAATLGHAGHVH